MSFMNLLNGIPTQTRQLCYISNGSDTAEFYDKTFQRSCVMFFGIDKTEARLFDGSAILALKPGNLNKQFDLSTADRKRLENPLLLPELDDITGFTV